MTTAKKAFSQTKTVVNFEDNKLIAFKINSQQHYSLQPRELQKLISLKYMYKHMQIMKLVTAAYEENKLIPLQPMMRNLSLSEAKFRRKQNQSLPIIPSLKPHNFIVLLCASHICSVVSSANAAIFLNTSLQKTSKTTYATFK